MYGSHSMKGINQTSAFSHSVNITGVGNVPSAQFLGPRTIILRLLTAAASQGLVLRIVPPAFNSSYLLQFFGPAVQCSQPNSTIADAIQQWRISSVQSFKGSLVEDANYYFAGVPDLSKSGNSSTADGELNFSNPAQPQPGQGSNQLWMAYSRYARGPTGARSTEDHYSVCQLYNASYSIKLDFSKGGQIIEDTGSKLLNSVDFPKPEAPYSRELMVQHAYSAVFWALADVLTGYMGIFSEDSPGPSGNPANFSEIVGKIEYTSLIGSSDLDAFFDTNHVLASTNTTLSDQRLKDISLAGNDTLDNLIASLSYNATLSFMSNDLLSYVELSSRFASHSLLRILHPHQLTPTGPPSWQT